MFKIISILLSLFLLSSCYSNNIVGKKILCLRLENKFNFEDIRSYEFITENLLVRTHMFYNEPIYSYNNDLSGEKRSYKLTSDTIEVYQNENKISEIINRKDLSINMPWDTNWNLLNRCCLW